MDDESIITFQFRPSLKATLDVDCGHFGNAAKILRLFGRIQICKNEVDFKLFLQKLWKINQSWNEPLSEDLSREWNHISTMLTEIPSLAISQFVKNSNKGINQLLIFSDVSVHCYATAVYLRSVEEHSIKVNLVFAKTRLVPVAKGRKKCKKLTVPRLELMGGINWCSY